MKGQRLFVRPLSAADIDTLRALHADGETARLDDAHAVEGLIGRLAGSTVAYLLWLRVGDAMVISNLFVAPDLRRIRIARSLVDEAAKLASSEGAASLLVAQDCKLARYFERIGFVSVEGTLTRTIP